MGTKILFGIILLCVSLFSRAQEVGQIRELKMMLLDIPFSGDAIQPKFTNSDKSEILSFIQMTWLDKHVTLSDFFHLYKDSSIDNILNFTITMIYIPTVDKVNEWVLISIVKEDNKSELVEIDYSKILKGKYILDGADYAGFEFIDSQTISWTNELFPMDPDTMRLVWIDKNTFIGTFKRQNEFCPPGFCINRVISCDRNKLESIEINTDWIKYDEQINVFYKEE